MAKVEVWVTLHWVSDRPLLSHSTYKYRWWAKPLGQMLETWRLPRGHSGLRSRGKRPLTLKGED